MIPFTRRQRASIFFSCFCMGALNAQEFHDENFYFGDTATVGDDVLDEMRGGFITTSGLQINFGIERAVYINGNLVTLTSLNVSNVGALAEALVQSAARPATAAAAVVAAQQAVGGVSSPAPVQSAVQISSPAQLSPSQPSSAQQPQMVGQSAAVAPVAATNRVEPLSNVAQVTSDAGKSLAVIQSGVGNTAQPGVIDPAMIGTLVQNTIDNQKIQSLTTINATVNSMEILKSMNLQTLINNAIADSLRR